MIISYHDHIKVLHACMHHAGPAPYYVKLTVGPDIIMTAAALSQYTAYHCRVDRHAAAGSDHHNTVNMISYIWYLIQTDKTFPSISDPTVGPTLSSTGIHKLRLGADLKGSVTVKMSIEESVNFKMITSKAQSLQCLPMEETSSLNPPDGPGKFYITVHAFPRWYQHKPCRATRKAIGIVDAARVNVSNAHADDIIWQFS